MSKFETLKKRLRRTGRLVATAIGCLVATSPIGAQNCDDVAPITIGVGTTTFHIAAATNVGHGARTQAVSSGTRLSIVPNEVCTTTTAVPNVAKPTITTSQCTSIRSDHHSANPWYPPGATPPLPYNCEPGLTATRTP